MKTPAIRGTRVDASRVLAAFFSVSGDEAPETEWDSEAQLDSAPTQLVGAEAFLVHHVNGGY